jgi:hypothetical protein
MKKGCKFAASNNKKISQTSKINNNGKSKNIRADAQGLQGNP